MNKFPVHIEPFQAAFFAVSAKLEVRFVFIVDGERSEPTTGA